MKQEIRTFRAATMDQAMDLVRRELGNEAVVLESKPVEKRRLLPWSANSQEVEVVAQPGVQKSAMSPIRETEESPVTGQQKLRTLAEMKQLQKKRTKLLGPVPVLPAETSDDLQASPDPRALPPDWGLPLPASNAAKVDNSVRHSNATVSRAPAEQQVLSAVVDHQQLTSLQTIVSRLERHAHAKSLADVPQEFYQDYLKLIEADVDDEIARQLISKLRLYPSNQTPKATSSMLTALIEREMRCAPPIKPQPGRREIVMVVGPTGVGKTTTLAKLAAHFQLREGLRVGLITVDTYRVGAIEQLQRYAEILRVPLRTAVSPVDLRTAIDELDDVDLIFIDTAGRGPCDNAKLNDLRELVQISAADHVLLALSLASGRKSLLKIAERFALASPTSLILTKLDEIEQHGGLLAVARDIAHPVSYLTTGQDVPDQIEAAHPARLVRVILGHDRIHQNNDQSAAHT